MLFNKLYSYINIIKGLKEINRMYVNTIDNIMYIGMIDDLFHQLLRYSINVYYQNGITF